MRRIVAAGLVEHYLKNALQLKRLPVQKASGFTPLRLEDLKGHFMVLGVGLTVSLIVKFIEKIFPRLFESSNKNRRLNMKKRPSMKTKSLKSGLPRPEVLIEALTGHNSLNIRDININTLGFLNILGNFTISLGPHILGSIIPIFD